jgi:hypothetical protein
MNDDQTAMQAGVDAGTNPEYLKQAADVQKWQDKVDAVQKFDIPALKQYALDRRYARGDSGFDVDSNDMGTFIDILSAFLVAKDPDLDVLPATATEPPSLDALRDAAAQMMDQDPQVQAAGQIATQLAQAAQQLDPSKVAPPDIAQQAMDAKKEELIHQQFEVLQAAYQKRQRQNKDFAETLEVVVSRMLKVGKLKRRGRKMVRSSLTIAVGWLKASWQERMGSDPIILQKIADLQDNISKAALLKSRMQDQSGDELEATTADYARQLTALQGQVERVVARGLAIDNVAGEDMTIAADVDVADYLDSPWICHTIAMRADDAQAEFKLTDPDGKSRFGQATRYTQRKPVMRKNETPLAGDKIQAADASRFTTGADSGQDADDKGVGEWVMVREIWDRDGNTVLTTIKGMKCWIRQPIAPVATERFYPFFLMPLGEVDGQRHPQSLISRSMKLVDDIARQASNERTHRTRAIPKTWFNEGQLMPECAKKLEGATTLEMVGLQFTNPNTDINTVLRPIEYPAMDGALYDDSRLRAKLERIWGVQEALSGTISVKKTLGEAEIQESGRQARTTAQRDILDEVFTELAQYTAEVALAKLTHEDVIQMVGPDAMWPAYNGPDDLARMVNIDIRAGSSGKPNTSAEREAWSTLLPMLQQGISQIGQLRNSSPADLADSLETLLRMTVERTGDRLDIDSLVPPPGPPPLPVDPNAPPQTGAPPPAGAPAMSPPSPPVAAHAGAA